MTHTYTLQFVRRLAALQCCKVVYLQHGGTNYCTQKNVAITSCVKNVISQVLRNPRSEKKPDAEKSWNLQLVLKINPEKMLNFGHSDPVI